MKLRRHPHLRKADPSDTDPLGLLRSLPPGAAREAERMFQSQHRADQRFEAHQTVESAALPNGGFERYIGARMSQAASTGGGRRRPTYPTQE